MHRPNNQYANNPPTPTQPNVPEDPLQVDLFDPSQYAPRGISCGATITLTDSGTGRGVTISRATCEARLSPP